MIWDGAKFRTLVKDKGMTLTELANRLNVSRQAVNDWTKNQVPKGSHLIRISKILDVSPGYFFPEEINKQISVPLHRTRLKERGFNQSLLLAKGIAKIYNLPMDYLNLKRIRATTPQVKLKGKDRIKNVSGAFAVQNGNAFKDKQVLLIDDVYTTGATITECSKTLKKAGAKDIKCLTLARVVNL